MSYNPDPVFRDGLNGYRKSAPPSAWERIESGLDHKRQRGMWLKIAAGLILLVATSTFLWHHNQTDTAVASNSQETSVTTLKIDTISSFVKEESEGSLRESSVASAERSRSMSRELHVESHKPAILNHKSSIVNRKSSIVSRQSSMKDNDAANAQVELQSVSINEPEEKKTSSIVEAEVEKVNEIPSKVEVLDANRANLTYTADQVNAKFTKPNVVPEATPEKKNASGLKKALDIAIDITNEGTVLGEIREKKNEWLSFNNLSNKTEPNK